MRIRKQRRHGPRKAELRRRTNRPFVEAPVTIRRGPDGSIHIAVEAPNGAVASLRVDNLPRPAGPAFSGWARQQLAGLTNEAPASVRLSKIGDEIEMWVYAPLYLGGVNLTRANVPKPMREWAARALGIDIREA